MHEQSYQPQTKYSQVSFEGFGTYKMVVSKAVEVVLDLLENVIVIRTRLGHNISIRILVCWHFFHWNFLPRLHEKVGSDTTKNTLPFSSHSRFSSTFSSFSIANVLDSSSRLPSFFFDLTTLLTRHELTIANENLYLVNGKWILSARTCYPLGKQGTGI